MHTRHEYGPLVWIDLESPNNVEVRQVAEEFGIAENIAEELLFPSSKARAEFYNTYAYIVMHFPALKHSHATAEQEVDFIVGLNFLITVHYDTIDPLHKFSKVFEVNAMLKTEPLGNHAGFLFFYTAKKLYKAIEHELDFVRRELALIEEHIFLGREIEMVSSISRAARALLNLRQTIEPHREILRTLEENGPAFFGEDFSPYLRALSNEYYRVHNHITRATDSLHELRETNNSLLSTKQNETIKVLTIMAFFTLPLSLIASIFEMNTHATPIVGTPYDFWIIIGLMGSLTLFMFWFFKHKKWL
jgi:magnesium transporter